jgi:TolB-like protein
MKRYGKKQPGARSQTSDGRPGSVCRVLLPVYRCVPATLCLLLIVFLSCYARPPRIYVRSEVDPSELKRIAVLPFDNLSGEEGAGESVTEIFTMELMHTRRFDVAEPGRVKKAIKGKRIRTTRDLDLDAARWLGESLDLNLILVGSVLDFEVREFQNKRVPVVTVILRLVHASTGTTLWSAYGSRKGDDKETFFGWGRVTSLSQLGSIVASDMLRNLVLR